MIDLRVRLAQLEHNPQLLSADVVVHFPPFSEPGSVAGRHSGANVMMTIFGDFGQFSAK
jgi:hypothetical protein